MESTMLGAFLEQDNSKIIHDNTFALRIYPAFPVKGMYVNTHSCQDNTFTYILFSAESNFDHINVIVLT